MEGNDIRELWKRIIALEAKVAVLEVEDEDYEILGTFAVPSAENGTVHNVGYVDPDVSTIRDISTLDIGDYGEDD